MKNRMGRAFAALSAIISVGCGIAAGIAIYKNRGWLKSFAKELAGEASPARPEPPRPEEVNIVIDRSREEE